MSFMAATKNATLVDVAKIGKLGGEARAKNLSEKQLSDAGRKAVEARWAKYREAKAQKAQESENEKHTAAKKNRKTRGKG